MNHTEDKGGLSHNPLALQIGKELLENPAVRKQPQPDDMLLWRLIGHNNVFMCDGEMWKRQSRIMRDALRQTTPIDTFTALARTTFSLIGDGGRVRWSDYTHRYTLDAVGTTVIGYDFEALAKPHGSFVRRYHDVMSAIASPAYVVLPSLERWLPRWSVRKMVDGFVDDFCKILQEKREKPGNDVITYMFQEPSMTEVEYRDNSIVTFIGGHVGLVLFEILYRTWSTQKAELPDAGHDCGCTRINGLLLSAVPRRPS